jgi:hypothetical protein
VAALAKAVEENRQEPRDEVHYRTRAVGPDGRPLTMLIVNTSAAGLMARAECDYQVGDRLRVTLPTLGVVSAEIRWSLGGRIGCRLDQPIPLASYYGLLAAMLKP